jgi:2-polyprenyl-3-methyl-5-hydroxy-6-metoxy-1,4-benzoquinol methylase
LVKSHIPADSFDSKYRERGAFHWSYYGNATSYTKEKDLTLDFFSDKSGTLLEVGCGDGVLLHLLSQNKGLSCFGIDISSVAIELAKQRGVSNCAVSTIENIKGTQDYVVMDNTLEHIRDYEASLDEVLRLLAPDGIFYLISPIQTHPLPMDYHAFSREELFSVLEERFEVARYERAEASMRFVCRKRHV